MPYINGVRVSNEEWMDRFSSLKKMTTGPNGENPGQPVELDEETGAPKAASAPSSRSETSQAAAKAAIADAMGVDVNDESVAALDVTGADAGPDSDDGSAETDDGDQADDTAATAAADVDPLTCPTCGFVAKSALGLRSHSRKHEG